MEEVAAMQAMVGEHIRISGRVVGSPPRRGVITEVRGEDGGPPYLVKFDDGHEMLCFPGPDCVVEHAAERTG
jgi:hypothetical protein